MRLPTVTDVERRLLRVGLPVLLSNAVLVFLPILARVYLGPVDYATWALLMTVVASSVLFDLGSTAFLQSAGYGVRVERRLYARSVGLAVFGVVIVTLVALVASLALSDDLSISTATGTFVALVAATGAAAAVRTTFSVMQARLQVGEEFTLRTRLSVAQSVAQVLVCWLALAVGWGLWALPVSLTLSVAPFLLVAHTALARREHRLPAAQPSGTMSGFATTRALSAVLVTASSQADRWVLASIAPATFVTNYDLALRAAALPLTVVLALFAGFIAEGAAAPGLAARRALVRSATLRVGVVVGLLSLGGLAIVLVALQLGVDIVNTQLVIVLLLALIWYGMNSLTAPTTMTFIGVGKPVNEFRYTVPVVLLSAIGWSIAAALGNPWLVPVTTLIAVTACASWFVHYGIHKARY